MSRFSKFTRSVALVSMVALELACVGGRERPEPSDDASPPSTVVGVTAGSGGAGVTSGSGASGGAGGGATTSTTVGSGGAPPFTPDCVCLRARAVDMVGCTSCCRSCFDTAEIGTCSAESDACAADVNGCQVAVDLAKACPADQNYETCIATAFDLVPSITQALAQSLLDCTCGSCAAACGTGDTCP